MNIKEKSVPIGQNFDWDSIGTISGQQLKITMDEHNHQKIVVSTIRREHPDILIFAIPNGGKRTALQGSRLKDEGVLAGVPDLMVAHAAHGYHGLFVEMKTPHGSTSKEQKTVIAQLAKEGYLCTVAKGYEQALSAIRDYLQNGASHDEQH